MQGLMQPRIITPPPELSFPEALPVSGRREEIARAIAAHQVVIVCGETGSGKTTQLPKIVMSLGRGVANGGRLIGHTQPRRIAASSTAKRIAQELNSPLGVHVGYKVRFSDTLQRGASIKLMTDGILLAETQGDPDLRAYDTLIIDEAHERSLNIDFLLGYLKQLLPRRPDLKLIITSATIDASRFAEHFASTKGNAPVIEVSGRLYPVEVRYRPFNEDPKDDRELGEALCDAVDELWREGQGDILVFMPGEREIRECSDALRKHVVSSIHRHAQVLPLFSRLSQAEQERVFEPSNGRRVVIATNVAETSLTVPGVRYVIDAGTARIKRYSFRNKVEQLQIEPISQASANQRAGRCGRVADGICIRLYSEKDFKDRARFTDPEVLRSSLAGVILRMKSLRLAGIEHFPFVEAPRAKAIADGYALLHELGAVDEQNELTATGAALSKLPLDPRIGRMIIEAKDRQALSEMLIIAAALSVQDPRERPMEAQEAADNAHKKFADERSEFISLLKLWKHYHERVEHKKSHSKLHKELKQEFLNPNRLREWHEVHSQLMSIVGEQNWRLNTSEATYEQLHCSLLAGLLGNIGMKSEDEPHYLGARGVKFYIHPGSHLAKKAGRWCMAAELTETTRLYARTLAKIEPQWLEKLGGHLMQRQLSEPSWDEKSATVLAYERGTLYGLPIYHGRRVAFAQRDMSEARKIFIREALVQGAWPQCRWPFLVQNQKLIKKIEELEHKSRRQDVLVDDDLIAAYYEQLVPEHVVSGVTFDKWYAEASRANPKLLHLQREELMRHEAAGITTEAFPKLIRLAGADCGASYVFEPGNPRDGLTATVPLFVLNQLSDERVEWLVPGMVKEKVTALVKSLHQKPRARLVPIAEFVDAFIASTPFAEGGLLDKLLEAVRKKTQLDIKRADFKPEQLGVHLFMNLRVVDEHGRQLGMGRNLAMLKAELGAQARAAFKGAFAELSQLKTKPVAVVAREQEKNSDTVNSNASVVNDIVRNHDATHESKSAEAPSTRYTEWSFGELPELMEIKRGAQTLVGFPALVDRLTHVEIDVFDEPEVASAKHHQGLMRLFTLQLKEPLKYLEKNIPELSKLAMLYMPLGSSDELRDQIVHVAMTRALMNEPLPHSAATFEKRMTEGRTRLNLIAQEVSRLCAQVLTEYAAALRKLKDAKPPREVADDVSAQLARLMPKRFLRDANYVQLQHYPRYLKAIVMRLDKLRGDAPRDAARMTELRPLEAKLSRTLAERKGVMDARLEEIRWLTEELRVSLFAQELRTPQPVSVKRLEKVWAQMAH